MLQYAELEVTTNFSFLHSASHAEEIIKTADTLGLSAIAVTDCKSLFDAVHQQNPSLTEKRTIIDLVGIKEALQNGRLKWVPTSEQLADGLTKLDADLMVRLGLWCQRPRVKLVEKDGES